MQVNAFGIHCLGSVMTKQRVSSEQVYVGSAYTGTESILTVYKKSVTAQVDDNGITPKYNIIFIQLNNWFFHLYDYFLFE